MFAITKARTFLRRFAADITAGAATIAAVLLPIFLGIAALVIDLGKVYVAQRELVAATDAAALAGAQDIYPGGAIAAATEYSSTVGHKNFNDRFGEVAMKAGYPKLSCSTTGAASGIPCLGADAANTIRVEQTVEVPLYFGPIFGVDTISVSAQATALAQGGERVPLNIAIVVDTTPSMNGRDNGCGLGSGATRLDCAKTGIITLLNQLDPNYDKVTLVGFPGTKANSAQKQANCAEDVIGFDNPDPNLRDVQAYNSSDLTYVYVGLTDDYSSSLEGPLNIGSALVKAASTNRAGANGDTPDCVGMEAKGNGNFAFTYYADAILAAQQELDLKGNPLAQDAIILLSDADANAPSSVMPNNRQNFQCQRAVSYAQNYANDNDAWIFAIGYGASDRSPINGWRYRWGYGWYYSITNCGYDTAPFGGLSPAVDTPRSPCNIMEAIASDPSRFFSTTDCEGSQNVSNLTEIFEQVAAALQDARLMPNDTT